MNPEEEVHLICHRCGRTLTPGAGNWYVVNIEAFADPSPPRMDEKMTSKEIEIEIEDIISSIRNMSERQLMEQVHRKLTVHLCRLCYEDWIEDPAA